MSFDWLRLLTKRAALRAFVASIAVSALLGTWALLAGEFGDLQLKVLLSSLSVSAASLCAMGGAALLESRGDRLLSAPAILLSGIGLVLLLFGLWSEVDDQEFWKTTATVCFFAVACSHASLLRLAWLAPRHAWLGPSAAVLVLLLAAYGTFMVWAEADSEARFRWLGVLSILVAAATLMTPVLRRLSREDFAQREVAPDAGRVDMLCPVCSARFHDTLGHVDCPRCRARFTIELRSQ